MNKDDADPSPTPRKDTLTYLAERLKMSVEDTIILCKKLGYGHPTADMRIPNGAQENVIQFVTRRREREEAATVSPTPTRPLVEVYANRSRELLSLPGVKGARLKKDATGKPTGITVFVESMERAQKTLPKHLEGYPIFAEVGSDADDTQ
jgi:hypothetical protein